MRTHEIGRIEAILESSEIGLWDWDMHNDIVLWDDTCFEMLGYAPQSFTLNYQTWVTLLHPEYTHSVQEEVLRQIKSGEIFVAQFPLRTNDGSYLWIEGRGKVVEWTEDGTPKCMVGTHINKTKEKEKDEQIDYQHRLFSEFMENSTVLIVMKDLFGRYQFMNPIWEEMTGLSPQYVLGKTDKEIFPEAIATRFMENDAEVLRTGQLIEVEEYLETPQGINYFESVKFPLKDAKGAITGICAIISNITERKKAEAELVHVYKQLEQVFENNAAGIFVVDSNRDILITNQHFCEILGYTKEELVGHNAIMLHISEETYKAFAPIFLEAKAGHRTKIEYCLKHKNGKSVWCELLETLCHRTLSTPIPSDVSQSITHVEAQSPIDPTHVHTMFDGDSALFQKLLMHFAEQLDGEFKTVTEAVRENHSDAGARIHALKGVSSNLGALHLAQACTHIDMCYKHKQPIDEASIVALESSIEAVKKELANLKLEEVAVLDDDAIHSALLSFKKRLKEADLIEPYEQASLVNALKGKVDTDALMRWSQAIDKMDYGVALEIMNEWEIT